MAAMRYLDIYDSPVGRLGLASDGDRLCELCFEHDDDFQEKFEGILRTDAGGAARAASPGLRSARAWLDAYFAGGDPGPLPPIAPSGTPFQLEVWGQVARIPYGELTTYGAIAAALSAQHGGKRQSARAVGGAVGRNPIPIIVPCHRVVGAGGNLTGFGGGIDLKIALLRQEGIDAGRLKDPRNGKAGAPQAPAA